MEDKQNPENIVSNPNIICKGFSKILGGKPTIVNNACNVSLYRDIPTFILGRESSFPAIWVAFFSFSDLDKHGRALNTGIFGLLEDELFPVLTSLRNNNITVSFVNIRYIFSRPRAVYVHFQSIESPLKFAMKVKEAMNTLSDTDFLVPTKDKNPNKKLVELGNIYSEIIGIQGSIINNSFLIESLRPIPATIEGRNAKMIPVFPAFLGFDSVSCNGKALNILEFGLLSQEVDPFLSILLENNILLGSIEQHWLYSEPQISYIHAEAIQSPIEFALAAKKAIRTLQFKEFIDA